MQPEKDSVVNQQWDLGALFQRSTLLIVDKNLLTCPHIGEMIHLGMSVTKDTYKNNPLSPFSIKDKYCQKCMLCTCPVGPNETSCPYIGSCRVKNSRLGCIAKKIVAA